MREFHATNVPWVTEQDQRFLPGGSYALSSRSFKWMKTQFKLPRNGSTQERLQSDPLARSWTVRRPLTRTVSTFQVHYPLRPGPRKERGIGRPVKPTACVLDSATEPDELKSFQPSLLCNRSLPMYLNDDRAVPPTSFEQMRGLTTWI